MLKTLSLISVCILNVYFFCTAFAAGSVTHFYVARETIPKLENDELRTLLSTYQNEYQAGAGYPDSGYIGSDTYGEESHWDPFIFAFADYIRETYPNPAKTNPKLLAFLMGVATHSVSDIYWHSSFITKLAEHDFRDQPNDAHSNADLGLDLILLVDKNLWTAHSLLWWVPIEDLLNVYARMGLSYTRADIFAKTAVYYSSVVGEAIITYPAYWIYKAKMPWGVQNYLTDPDGGLLTLEQKCADYNNELWKRVSTLEMEFAQH